MELPVIFRCGNHGRLVRQLPPHPWPDRCRRTALLIVFLEAGGNMAAAM